jgi:hypothetical protein
MDKCARKTKSKPVKGNGSGSSSKKISSSTQAIVASLGSKVFVMNYLIGICVLNYCSGCFVVDQRHSLTC